MRARSKSLHYTYTVNTDNSSGRLEDTIDLLIMACVFIGFLRWDFRQGGNKDFESVLFVKEVMGHRYLRLVALPDSVIHGKRCTWIANGRTWIPAAASNPRSFKPSVLTARNTFRVMIGIIRIWTLPGTKGPSWQTCSTQQDGTWSFVDADATYHGGSFIAWPKNHTLEDASASLLRTQPEMKV